jgi:spermidine/putrescine transport system substrate-binding protein
MPDSLDAELVRRLQRSLVTRRSVLRGLGMGAVLGASSGLLAACGSDGTSSGTSSSPATDLSSTEKILAWSNWPLYIDVDEKSKERPTLKAFTARTGIDVTYTEDVNDNDEFFGKVRPQLAAGKSTGRDLVTLTDWMAGRMISLGYVQKLDKARIPNAANLQPALAKPSFDADRSYTMPWQSGLTGIAYNTKATGGKPVMTIGELLTDPKLKGRVTALTEMRDTMGLILLDMGKDPSDFTDADFEAAIEMLDKAVKGGQIRQFTGNDYAQGLAAGNIAACIAWSGDVIQLQADDPGIAFQIPESGAMIWSDNLMIPKGSQHQANAHALIDYYYDPAVAAQVAAYVNYICPVKGAQDAMRKIDAELADNPLIFPDAEALSRTHDFMSLDDAATERKYTDLFTGVTGA